MRPRRRAAGAKVRYHHRTNSRSDARARVSTAVETTWTSEQTPHRSLPVRSQLQLRHERRTKEIGLDLDGLDGGGAARPGISAFNRPGSEIRSNWRAADLRTACASMRRLPTAVGNQGLVYGPVGGRLSEHGDTGEAHSRHCLLPNVDAPSLMSRTSREAQEPTSPRQRLPHFADGSFCIMPKMLPSVSLK